jgi:uncharacterized damage-inducible protein DinB
VRSEQHDHALPVEAPGARTLKASPSVAELFAHIHFVRLVFVLEGAPEFALTLPAEEWAIERETARVAVRLHDSARAVREPVKGRVDAGWDMDVHYDHPILLLQHMIWHEGYHHGQIKLALKAAGCALSDEHVGPLTWSVWMNKT